MKLVADIDNIMSNLNVLSADIEEYQSAMANFNGASVNCSLDEVKSLIESYKNSISEDLNKLNTSSEDYKTLVDECCTEYQANEANVQVIDIEKMSEIISNNTEVTVDYKGDAATALSGLPSTELIEPTLYKAQKIVEKYQGRDIESLSNSEFLEYIGAAAQIDYQKSGILPSITLAQAICESAWGNSSIGNNLFGIKCGSGWTGKRVSCRTKEQSSGGGYYSITADFRDYDSIVDGIADHSALLNTDWYAPVRKACDNNDAYEACRQLKACNYATSKAYANTLISIIEDNDLTQYDPPKKA